MPIKDGKWKPMICFEKHHGNSDCDGHMVLRDVRVSGGKVVHDRDGPHTYHTVTPPLLTKIWACNECGFVFVE